MKAELILNKELVKPVNPLIFGHFIEFMRDCIDDGMWAQLLKNRSFEISEHIKDGIPAPWYRTGVKDVYHFKQDWADAISQDGCSLSITVRNHYDGFAGIAQDSVCLQNGRYEIHLWMKSEHPLPVSIEVYDREGRNFLSEPVTVFGGWRTYTFSFLSTATTYTGTLEIRLHGNGVLLIDAVSLTPSDTIGGIWPEVFDRILALNPSVIRFPGGCFADCYHWEDGIGGRDKRPVRKNAHWGGYEDNSFGTDEYMEFCRLVGCEPMICVNFGSGTPEEAAHWVEYCNGAPDTTYGRIRAENGHPEPYHVRYWDIGNETFGDWEIGHTNAVGYAEKYIPFYQAMKKADPDITFMVCGGDGDSVSQDWNQMISKIIKDRLDAVCLHMYAQKEILSDPSSEAIYYATVGSVTKYEQILKNSWETVRLHGNPDASIAVTEYNVGTILDTYREQTLEAALFNAGMLNMFLRNTEKLIMCNLSDLVNGWPGGCIVSQNGHAFGTCTYHVLSMYAQSRPAQLIASHLSCPSYHTEQQIGNIEPLTQVPYVDTAACLDACGRIIVFAVNRSCEEELSLSIDFGHKITSASVTTITSEKTSDMNTLEKEYILPRTTTVSVTDNTVTLPKNSASRILLEFI